MPWGDGSLSFHRSYSEEFLGCFFSSAGSLMHAIAPGTPSAAPAHHTLPPSRPQQAPHTRLGSSNKTCKPFLALRNLQHTRADRMRVQAATRVQRRTCPKYLKENVPQIGAGQNVPKIVPRYPLLAVQHLPSKCQVGGLQTISLEQLNRLTLLRSKVSENHEWFRLAHTRYNTSKAYFNAA
jgi:hypothetical protein